MTKKGVMRNKSIEEEIGEFCKLNGIEDIQGFTNKCLVDGFNIRRYGTSPMDNVRRQNGEVNDGDKPCDGVKSARRGKITVKRLD